MTAYCRLRILQRSFLFMHVMRGVSAMQNVLNLLLFYSVYSFSVFETVSLKELKKLFQDQFEDIAEHVTRV